MFDKLSVKDLQVAGKRVLVRVDFNVPVEDGKITDNTRIVRALPTLRYVLDEGGSLVVMSHLGRPGGLRSDEFSLKPVSQELSKLLGRDVIMAPDCTGEEVERICAALKPGDVVLLENLRFHEGEKANDPAFAAQLAKLGDEYVNDAFGACHRAHASVQGITAFHTGAMGLLVQKELEYFGKALSAPRKPFVAIVGGAKVHDKLPVLENLFDRVDTFLIGGGMCYTFLKAKGIEVGSSKLDEDNLEMAASTLRKAEKAGVEVRLPFDHVIADRFAADANIKTVEGAIPEGWIGLDIGPKTAEDFARLARSAGTLVWNGPLGVFEMEPFSKGSRLVAQAVSDCPGTSIIGGGDTASMIRANGLERKMSHISTGGGASLELLQGKTLPGVAAISDRH
ncbi:MAG: phosphoglycerate kinase [Planctomycetota bacterium]|nr:phosphoglycerate kinase [Planctomycetota bacterium]